MSEMNVLSCDSTGLAVSQKETKRWQKEMGLWAFREVKWADHIEYSRTSFWRLNKLKSRGK
jgi:hypothetical protein